MPIPAATRRANTGSASEPPSDGRSAFVKTLLEYKEIVAALLVFSGAIGGALTYFATRQQLDETRCLLRHNVIMIEGRMDAANLSQLLVQNLEETVALEGKGPLTGSEAVKHTQLKAAAVQIGQKLADANNKVAEALEKLKTGECSHP